MPLIRGIFAALLIVALPLTLSACGQWHGDKNVDPTTFGDVGEDSGGLILFEE